MLRCPRHQALVISVLVVGCWLAPAGILGWPGHRFVNADRYDIPLWVAQHLVHAALAAPARRLGGGSGPASTAEMLVFFGETSAVSAAERDLAYAMSAGKPPGPAQQELQTSLEAVTQLRDPVETRLAMQLSTVVAAEGLTTRLPLYRQLNLVWPPVAFAFDLPPYVLLRSPRSRIRLEEATLLRADLTQSQIEQIEARAATGGDAALVVRVGGVATYPSIVEDDDSYADCLELIAHEWTHQYLAFHPLGLRYFQSQSMTTINETVANVVGHELAQAMRAQFPLGGNPPRVAPVAPPPDRSIDFDRTMHDLRLEVDGLLAEGKVAEAEQRMEDTRQYLVAHGYYVPKLNQAYFAFYGSYANTAASSSPIGPELATLRQRTGSLSAFVHAVENVRSPDELLQLVSASEG